MNLVAFLSGLVLFGLNLALLVKVARGTLDAAVPGDAPRSSKALGFLFLLKLVSLFVGAYVVVGVFHLPAVWFVVGVASGMAILTIVVWTRLRVS